MLNFSCCTVVLAAKGKAQVRPGMQCHKVRCRQLCPAGMLWICLVTFIRPKQKQLHGKQVSVSARRSGEDLHSQMVLNLCMLTRDF